MNRGSVRAGLVAGFVLLTVSVAVALVRSEVTHAGAERRHAEFADALNGASLLVADVVAAQQTYTASGADLGASRTEMESRLDALERAVRDLGEAAPEDGRSDMAAAVGALEALRAVEAKARASAMEGQRLLAADLLAGEGRVAATGLIQHLGAARSAAFGAEQQRRATLRLGQSAAVASVALVGTLFLVLLAKPAPSAEQGATPGEAGTAGQALDRPGEDSSADSSIAEPLDDLPLGPVPTLEPSLPHTPPARLDLDQAARLCTDLARVDDVSELPELLDRACDALGASGVIVWIASPDRRTLTPALVRGFPRAVAQRLGRIQVDDDNATAAAFREVALQVVAAEPSGAGAVVAPLVSSAGCLGVLAAELREGRDVDAATHALARIVAAQLASIVDVAEPARENPAAAEGAV